MSFLKGLKDYGFGRPYNGQPFNEPVIDATNPGPIDIDQSTPGGTNIFDGMFQLGGGSFEKFCYSGHTSSIKAYMKCPTLSTVINRKAQAHINGRTWIMNKEGKEADTVDAKKLRKLLKKPNPIQSWKQFEAQGKIYMQLFGFNLVLPIIPAGYEKYGPIEASSLWNIPPYMIDVMETSKLFYQTDLSGMIKSIKLNYKGYQTDLPLNSLGLFKDFTPSFNTLIFPESRVSLLESDINIIIAALESQNEVISYAGSQGLITPDSGGGQYVGIPLTDPQKEELQADFKRQYGIRRGQFRYIISPAAIKWQEMGKDPRKLMLIEFVEEASKAIADGYGFPPHLLGLLDPTFNNQNAAEKGMYQNTIIPESDSMYEEWNNFFRTEDLGLVIEKDFDHLSILQEDREMMGRALFYNNQALLIEFQNNLITANEWREANGRDTIDGWDVYYHEWAKSGMAFGAQPAAPLVQGTPPTNPVPGPTA